MKEVLMNTGCKLTLLDKAPVITVVFLAISSFALSLYLPLQSREICWVILFLLSLLAVKTLHFRQFSKKEISLIGVFCMLLDASLILGYHIKITGDTYGGSLHENFISAYSFADIISFLLILPCLILFGLKAFSLTAPRIVANCAEKKEGDNSNYEITAIRPISLKTVFSFLFIPLICWLPYLLIYWPGFIFNDTLSSFSQAMGLTPFNNHHPFLYTCFIMCCLKVSTTLGFGPTGGCVLYCIVQMYIMAFVFSYLSVWIKTRCNLKRHWELFVLLIFSFSPYIGTYSIAMWKDPIFSVALVLLTILIMDFVLSKGIIVKSSRSWPILCSVSLFFIAFSRNNGIYIIICLALIFILIWLFLQKRFHFIKHSVFILCGLFTCIIALNLIITGPVYKSFNIASSPKAESIGILLNQMARVAAVGGNMTEDDRKYLDSIIPIDQYETLYSPTCVDNLKWSSSFNAMALENNFFKHWFSLFLQNPRIYFEAWELQTFGFWTINVPDVYTFGNIGGGAPLNTLDDNMSLDTYQINIGNKLNNNGLRSIFTQDNQSIPIGYVFWFLFYLSICLILRGRGLWLTALIPSIALLATLVIASPIWYWPRYAAAVQLLIPFYIALFIFMTKYQDKSNKLEIR